MHGSVTVSMSGRPKEIWDLLADVTRIGEFSPETLEAEWLDGATSAAVGVRFRGHVRRNGRPPMYWTTCRITTCEPERDFAFGVEMGNRIVNTWRYQLRPTAAGTDVTESFELASSPPMRLYWLVAGRARGRTNERNMRTTLERIKAVVEGAGRPPR